LVEIDIDYMLRMVRFAHDSNISSLILVSIAIKV